MRAGLVVDWDRLTVYLTLASTYSRSAGATGVTCQGTALSRFTSGGLEVDGVRLVAKTGYAINPPGGEFYRYELWLEWHPDWTGTPWKVEGTGFKSSMSSEVRFLGVRVFIVSGGYRLEMDSIEWYTDGTLRLTLPGVALEGTGLAPTSVPVFGVPVKIIAGASPDAVPVSYGEGETLDCVEVIGGNATTGTVSASGTATAGGGWTFHEGGVERSLPVSLTVLDPPSGSGCPFGIGLPALGASATNSLSATGRFSLTETVSLIGDGTCGKCPDGSDATPPMQVRWWDRVLNYESEAGSVMALPNLPKDLVRLQDATGDYEAFVHGLPVPTASAAANRTCVDLTFGECPCPAVTYNSFDTAAVRNPGRVETLEVLGPTVEAGVEDAFGQTTGAVYSASAEKVQARTFFMRVLNPGGCHANPPPIGPGSGGSGCCAPTGETGYYRRELASSAFPSLSGGAGSLDFLTIGDPESRYINLVAHPHASVLYFYPNDFDSENWKVYGSKRRSVDYWIPLRQQWGDLEGVSVVRATGHRIDLPSAVLAGPNGVYLEAEPKVRIRSGWLGISRFEVDERSFPATLELTASSGSRWSALNASVSAEGAGIRVAPDSTTGVEVSLSLIGSGASPYYYPAIAKQYDILLPSGRDADIYLESATGERVLLGSGAGTFDIPAVSDDTVYAGTWVQDYLAVSGADVAPNGDSAGTFRSSPRSSVPQLLVGFTAARLVYVFDTLPDTTEFVLPYPTLRAVSSPVSVGRESCGQGALLWDNAPGVRYGTLRFWDTESDAWLPAPVYLEPAKDWTVTDYAAWRNLIEGSRFDLVSGDLTGWFHQFEGDTASDAAKDTLALPWTGGLTAGRWLIVNKWREAFPLACFPRRMRDPVTLADVSPVQYEQRVYCFGSGTRRIFSRPGEVDMRSYGSLGAFTGVSTQSLPAGWFSRQFRGAVSNAESSDEVIYGGEVFATASRWHSYFALMATREDVGAGLIATNLSRGVLALDSSGRLLYGGANLPLELQEVGTLSGAADIALSDSEKDMWYLQLGLKAEVYRASLGEAGSLVAARSGSGTAGGLEVLWDGSILLALAEAAQVTLSIFDAAGSERVVATIPVAASAVSCSGSFRRLYVATVEGGTAVLRVYDSGTLLATHTLGAATRARVESLRHGGAVVVYGDSAGSFARIDETGAIVETGATGLGADDAPYDIAELVSGGGWRLVFYGSVGGTARLLSSDDMREWA